MPLEIIRHGTQIDFIGKRHICALVSAGLIIASLIAIPLRGIKLGIDFAGGNEVQVRFDDGVAADEGMIRAVLAELPDVKGPSVVRFGTRSDNEFLIRFMGSKPTASLPVEGSAEEAKDAEEAKPAEGAADASASDVVETDRAEVLAQALRDGVGALTVQRVEFVGPKVGAELTRDGLLALLWASLAILVYVAFRFGSRFAPGAVVAVIHDLAITAGLFVILGFEFDLRILAAMLAILGYSLNDTVIIYDRIRENMEIRTKRELEEVLNLSVNQTLSRTLLTSGTTLAVVLTLYFLGGDVIRPFAFAMVIGVIVGTYSSIYIASPLLLMLEQYLDDPSKKRA